MHGPQGREERSRRPSPSPRHAPDQVVAALLDARGRQPSWGATTPWSSLYRRHPCWPWPARSPVCAIRSRHGGVPKTRKRRVIGPPGQPTSAIAAPNDVRRADFIGPFTTGDGHNGSPLTSTDGDSRLLRRCQALSSTSVAAASPVFARVCKEFGRPWRLRTDNGVPLAANTLAQRSPWSAWGVRLGIWPAGIAPGHPQQHGRHERRYRPLQATPARPPGASRRAQPQQFHHCREELNQARPQEALDMGTPAAGYDPSPRARPNTLPPRAYPDRVVGRDVSATGGLRWNQQGGNVSPPCVGDSIGLEDIDDGVWHVSCGSLTPGRRHERPSAFPQE